MTDESSIIDSFIADKIQRKQDGERRREAAKSDFFDAAKLARDNGHWFVRNNEAHYQFTHKSGWMVNVYPGNRRIYADRNKSARAPFLRLPDEWTLLDVVKTAITAK